MKSSEDMGQVDVIVADTLRRTQSNIPLYQVGRSEKFGKFLEMHLGYLLTQT